jgi:hypothetical protein
MGGPTTRTLARLTVCERLCLDGGSWAATVVVQTFRQPPTG